MPYIIGWRAVGSKSARYDASTELALHRLGFLLEARRVDTQRGRSGTLRSQRGVARLASTPSEADVAQRRRSPPLTSNSRSRNTSPRSSAPMRASQRRRRSARPLPSQPALPRLIRARCSETPRAQESPPQNPHPTEGPHAVRENRMNYPRTRAPVGNHMHESSASNILPDKDSGKLHGADSSNSGVTQDRHVVGDETGECGIVATCPSAW